MVFQPHTYTRTLELFDEFVDAFVNIDVKSVTLVDIYAAREPDNGMINSKMVADAVKAKGRECFYASGFDTAKKILLENAENGDIILTMGAGDVYKIGESLL